MLLILLLLLSLNAIFAVGVLFLIVFQATADTSVAIVSAGLCGGCHGSADSAILWGA